MNDPYDSLPTSNADALYDLYDDDAGARRRKPNRERPNGPARRKRRRTGGSGAKRPRGRVEAADGTFRCRRCKTMVGTPISGGRHRNHCPLCLYSRHVDRSRPGDRLSDCRSMMQPVGLFTRGDGEQVLVHECRGCGVVRHNRVAADDNTVATMRLPVLAGANLTGVELTRTGRPA